MAKTEMEMVIRITQEDNQLGEGTFSVTVAGETVRSEPIDGIIVIPKNKDVVLQPVMIGESKDLSTAIYSCFRSSRKSEEKFFRGHGEILAAAAKLIHGDIVFEGLDEKKRSH